MPCFFQIVSEMLPEIYTVEKCDFLKPIIHSQQCVINVLTPTGARDALTEILSFRRGLIGSTYCLPSYAV